MPPSVKVLITGAGGMLGRDVRRAAEAGGDEVVALDRAAVDVTDADAVAGALERERPDVAVNCAAWTDVDGAEADEEGARRLNEDGARNVAAAAAAVGAAVVQVSTDYVFDGAGIPAGGDLRPYVESDPTGPRSAYGRTKLAGELAALAANPRAQVVRTAWLFGVGGANFVETMLGLAATRDEVRVVADQIGCPTYTDHLAAGLLALARDGEPGVHHLAGAGRCSWCDLAAATFAEAGVDCRAEPTTTAEFPRPAPRPAWSVLGSERPGAVTLPPWRDGLRAYLAER
ncbi:MAG: dTDP-4-dehydrorhamnose reductase [Solirubrobacterales bacterium]|nr:dTDP-4-dehydrorhamnose reductase [Solirubrobacterales bacterium]